MDTRMRTLSGLAAFVVVAGISQLLFADSARAQAPPAPAKTLQAFASDEELVKFLKSLGSRHRSSFDPGASSLEEVQVTGSRIGEGSSASPSRSITNNQHAGVDEGGIVKLHGNYLVMLRRGRLFTVDIRKGHLRPVSEINAYGPGMSPRGTWYDELLVSGNKVVVIGYSYARGGTEVGIFDIDTAGKLRYGNTWHFISNDYYSSRNYASRLIGNKLIMYTPLQMPYLQQTVVQGLPGIRKWRKGWSPAEGFAPITNARNIYRIPGRLMQSQALHNVTVCDLLTDDLQCTATGLVGGWGQVFYVSPQAVYVWAGGYGANLSNASAQSVDNAPGTLYRMPLDGSAPQAVGVFGTPVDQLSFDETEDGFLNVVLRSLSLGNGMAQAEFARGEVALLRLPLTNFGDGLAGAPLSMYRMLPTPPNGAFQNRFVQNKLLYGSGEGWWGGYNAGSSKLVVVATQTGAVTEIPLPHGVDRIEAMGDDAVVVGERGKDLHFSGIRLSDKPERAQQYVLKHAAQGELRTHGFFYQPAENGTGILGLPVRRPTQPGYAHLTRESASIVFLRDGEKDFENIGELESDPESTGDDNCKASCVDWYGNSRPIFLEDRVLALMGYEIVEGRIGRNNMREVARTSFQPRARTARAYW